MSDVRKVYLFLDPSNLHNCHMHSTALHDTNFHWFGYFELTMGFSRRNFGSKIFLSSFKRRVLEFKIKLRCNLIEYHKTKSTVQQ